MDFSGNHILTIDQFERSDIDKLFSVADNLEPYASKQKITRALEGAILGNMFFEPSTRTRISFGASFNLLGGNVREITEAGSSSLAKGESLADTAQVLSGYSDIIVMRHPEEGSVQKFAEASRVPVINGGDGLPASVISLTFPPRRLNEAPKLILVLVLGSKNMFPRIAPSKALVIFCFEA